MSSENTRFLTKDNLDLYLKELAKEYKRLCGKAMPAEIILVGGASVLANYGFRNMTTDVDAIIQASSAMKEAATRVGDKFGLPYGWVNANFMQTPSYSRKLVQHSTFYKSFSGVLDVRTISAEYLIAMKLRSDRKYKHDLSDILGVLAEHQKQGQPITMKEIRRAVIDLYGTWDDLPLNAQKFIGDVMARGDFDQMYAEVCAEEQNDKTLLNIFEQAYPGVMNAQNVDSILTNMKTRQPLIAQIREAQAKEQRSEESTRPDEDLQI